MNTIKGMIKDLRREETHIGGCTTKGELIIALEGLERSVELPYNATNGDMIRAMFPSNEIEIEKGIVWVHRFGGNRGWQRFLEDWWNAPYKVESEDKE